MREVLAATLLEALGVPTSRAFSLIETGEALERGDEPSPTRSAVLVRLSAQPHPFRNLPARRLHGRADNIETLVEHCIAGLYHPRESPTGMRPRCWSHRLGAPPG
jgi:uncharacterized protein YdiU (UPF0061 family)